MSSLERYQADLFNYILGNETSPDLSAEIAKLGNDPTETASRLAVYRNNYQHSMRESLADSFPVIKRLLGDDLFYVLARDYVLQTPPTSASLLDYGHGFLDYLADHSSCEDLVFLKDVGQIEWLYIQCFHGHETACITLYDLLDVPEEKLPEVTFTPQPNLYLFHSPYPVLDIWQANLEEDVPELNLNELPATYLMLYRQAHDVVPMQLNALAYYFLVSLNNGMTIEQAWQNAQDKSGIQADDGEVSDVLTFLIQQPVFKNLTVKERS